MAWWITVYCRRSVSGISAEALRAGLTGGDPAAPAGGDYETLAESFEVDGARVGPALAALRIERYSDAPLDVAVHYRGPEERPITVHLWTEASRVAEELAEAHEVRDPPEAVHARLSETREIVALELGFPMLEDMGVVIAFELARYLAQKGDGLIADDDDRWQEIRDGAFVEL